MAKTRRMLKRIRAVRNIRTVTKAMETVASARFRKAHDRLLTYRPFARQVAEMVSELISRTGAGFSHPLLAAPAGLKRDVLLVIASARGLCGAYNANVLRLALERRQQLRQDGYEVRVHVAGARAVQYLAFAGCQVDRVYDRLGDAPEYVDVGFLAQSMIAEFLGGSISGLEVAYTQFISPSQQRPGVARLLPLLDLAAAPRAAEGAELPVFDLFPSTEALLNRLLPVTVRLRLFECFLEAGAAEQLMRRTAMRSASENAEEMLRELRVRYNRIRQAQITTELAEIVGGRAGR